MDDHIKPSAKVKERDAEKKRLEGLKKKKEREALLAKKEKRKLPKKFDPPPKITRAQILSKKM